MIVPSLSHGGNPTVEAIGRNTIKVVTKNMDGAFIQLNIQSAIFPFKLQDRTSVSGVGQAKLNDRVYFFCC